MVRERFQQHIQYVLKSEVKDHRKICQQECKFKILETVIDEDILAREQAWIQLLGPTLNQDLSQLHLCALYRRDMMKEKREFINFDVNEDEEDDNMRCVRTIYRDQPREESERRF